MTPMAVSGMAQQPASSSKKMLTVLALLALLGAGLGVVLFIVFGSKKEATQTQASEPPSKVEVAGADPAKSPAGDHQGRPEVKAETPPVTPPTTPETKPDTPPEVKAETKPEVTKPEVTKPEVTKPDVTKPEVTKPDVTKPDVAKPDVTKPERKVGKVTINFDGPSKALVLIDGRPHGRETSGRVTIELAAGEHTVRVQAKGYKPADTKVRVEAGGSRDVKLTLEKRKAGVNAVHDPFAD
jgi:hypothetical protein